MTITTYSDFRKLIKSFSSGKLNFVTIVAEGGLGKTYIIEQELATSAPLIITGHITPMQLYIDLYHFSQVDNHGLVVFDDVDNLLKNKTIVSLLKQLCDTKEEKTVKYLSSTDKLKNVPQEFNTCCKILLCTNHNGYADNNLQALMTRSHFVKFVPQHKEILAQLKKDEVSRFMEKFSNFANIINFRIYQKAKELQRCDLDWHTAVLDEMDVDKDLISVWNAERIGGSDKHKAERFCELSGKGKSTYYLKRKILKLAV